MNWLDILLIVVIILIFVGGLVWLILGIKEDETSVGVFGFIMVLGIIAFIFFCSWFVMDKKSGSTVGEITSVDKNFFGTTAVYIKVNNNSEEKYCVENEKIAEKANELIGKKVKITYGKRVGFYSTGACSNAPIDIIESIENN